MAKPDRQSAPSHATLTKSIEACIANGDRILDDSLQLEFQEPPASRLVLAMLAQEEFAKAFLLFLVRESVISWSAYLLRAMNDHACKHLVGTVIEYVCPRWDESYEQTMERIKEEVALGDNLPLRVADAISILRHEKIGRWESRSWEWAEPPDYDVGALRVAEGSRDRIKQDALYVRLARDGRIASIPLLVSKSSSDNEYELARNYRTFVTSLLKEGGNSSSQYAKIREFITVLFARHDASGA
jgi:AbiV family abortive infection protein